MPGFDFGSEGFPVVKQMQTGRIYDNAVTLLRATLNAVETLYPGDVVRYYLAVMSAGTSPPTDLSGWEEVELGVEHVFTMTGEDAYLRVVFVGLGGAQTFIEDLEVQFVEAT